MASSGPFTEDAKALAKAADGLATLALETESAASSGDGKKVHHMFDT